MIISLAFFAFCIVASVAQLPDIEPSLSTDSSGQVHLTVPNGICFTTGQSQQQSAQSPQSIRGPKGDVGPQGPSGTDGRNGSDGRDARDGPPGPPGNPGTNAQQSVDDLSLFETPGPFWVNVNRTAVPTVSVNEVVGLVTFRMFSYFHGQVTPQFICRFENEDGDRFYSPYSALAPYDDYNVDLNIGCPLPNATAWPTDKRKATVTVWFRNRTEVPFSGKNGDNQIVFITSWTNYSYGIQTGDVIISGNGFDPDVNYTASFTWPNGTVMSVKSQPNSLRTVIFNIKAWQSRFVGKELVTISIKSPSGTEPYVGSPGGNQVLLEEPAKHASCQPGNYKVLNDVWRKKSNRDQSNVQCDQRTGLTNGWYRIDDSIGGKLPETCVPTQSCGTHAPGWLQGTHPAAVGVEVSDTVCFHWSSNCCNWNAAVNVVNCGSFYVYNFRQPPTCSLAYCGDA